MPFLYTAAASNNYNSTNALFADKGLTNLAPVKPNDVLLVGRPHQYEIAYGSYIFCLSAFLKATVEQSRVSANDNGQFFKLPPAKQLPLILPPLLLKPNTPLSNEGARNEMLNKLGAGAEITQYQEISHVSIESPTFAQISNHLSLFDTDNKTTTNTTNLSGLHAFFTTVKILTAFLSTHHYAAFQSPDSSAIHSAMYLRVPNEVDEGCDQGKIDIVAELVARGLPPVTMSSERKALVGSIPMEADGVMNLKSAVVVAQPSPFSPEINFGPAGMYIVHI